MKNLLFLLIALSTLSCETFKDTHQPIVNPSPEIATHIAAVTEVTSDVKKAADATIKEADGIKAVTATISATAPKESKEIDLKADNIKGLQEQIKDHATKLVVSNQNLINAQTRVLALETQNAEKGKEIAKLQEELKKEKDEKKAALFSKLMYLIIASVILGAICIVCAIRGEAKAMWGAATCGAVIVISLGISFYSTQLAIVGAVALVAGLVLVVWTAYSEYTARKATKELVDTVEVAKQKMDPTAKKEIFGEGALLGQAHILQSPATKNLVNKLRVKSKKYWEPTVVMDGK